MSHVNAPAYYDPRLYGPVPGGPTASNAYGSGGVVPPGVDPNNPPTPYNTGYYDGSGYPGPGYGQYAPQGESYSDAWAAGRAGYHGVGALTSLNGLAGGEASKLARGWAAAYGAGAKEGAHRFGGKVVEGVASQIGRWADPVERWVGDLNKRGAFVQGASHLGGMTRALGTEVAESGTKFANGVRAMASTESQVARRAFREAALEAAHRGLPDRLVRNAGNAAAGKKLSQRFTDRAVNDAVKTATKDAAVKGIEAAGGTVAKGLARFVPFMDAGIAALDMNYAIKVSKDENASAWKKGFAWATAAFSTVGATAGSIPGLGLLVKPVTGTLSFVTGMTAAAL